MTTRFFVLRKQCLLMFVFVNYHIGFGAEVDAKRSRGRRLLPLYPLISYAAGQRPIDMGPSPKTPI
ncbi:hypothetical protein EGN72_15735 [Pseudorhodobacter sp. E13]|nr:hypothetical protein EGN72_15735 [Pseudorhodobacter sp. E13]